MEKCKIQRRGIALIVAAPLSVTDPMLHVHGALGAACSAHGIGQDTSSTLCSF